MTVQSITKSDFDSLYESRIHEEILESIFLQSMLKSMRLELHFVDKPSPFGSKSLTFQEVLEQQDSNFIASLPVQESPFSGEKKRLNSAESQRLTPSLLSTNPEQKKNNSEFSSSAINEFVRSLWPAARRAASVIGLDPKILIAQAALETGWGKFIAKDGNGSSSNNLFNIKTGSDNEAESVTIKTTEYVAGTPVKVNASFRSYESIEQSFNDYVSLIMGSERYQSALANSGNPEQYINELHQAGYATDPQYATRVLSIYHSLCGVTV